MPKRNESVNLGSDLIMSQSCIAGFGGITDAEGKQGSVELAIVANTCCPFLASLKSLCP